MSVICQADQKFKVRIGLLYTDSGPRFFTCIILSSETEQITQGSLGFQEKSEIFAVCPPWINKSSGGPSSASSADCSSPIFDKSHTCRRRSVPEEAKIVSLCGDH